MTTTCTGTGCYGKVYPGQLLRCPSCGGSLVLYKRTAPVVALKAAA